MTLPDDAGTDTGRPRNGRTTLVAVIAGMAGLIALGTLTGPDPETVPAATSTTSATIEPPEPPINPDNFSIGQIATGEPLEWERVAAMDDIFPVNVIEYEGTVFLFGSDSPIDWSYGAEGLIALRSDDGVEWESVGTVLDGLAISTIHTTAHGLVAIERQPGERGLHLWQSADAEEWIRHQVPIGIESEYVRTFATAAGGNDDVLVVAPSLGFDPVRLLEERLDLEVDPMNLGIGTQTVENGPEIVVYGPLGFPAIELTASELGLSEQERVWLSEGLPLAGGTEVWSLGEGSDWHVTVFEEVFWLDSIAAIPDGNIVASGYGGAGATLWSSVDGVSWQVISPTTPVRAITTWRNQLVGIAESSALEVMASADGVTWEAIGLGKHFPESLSWHSHSLVADEGGIAVVVMGQQDFLTAPRQVVVLTADNGATLNLDLSIEVYELDTGDTTHRYRPGGPGVDVDLINQELTFLDKDTGDPLAKFPFEELREAEAAYWSTVYDPATLAALAFSSDGSTWVIEDTSAMFGADQRILQLEMTTDRVIAVLTSPTLGFDSEGGGSGLEIWSAPIP